MRLTKQRLAFGRFLTALLIVALPIALGRAKSEAGKQLRAELASLQKETGISLAYFGWYVGTLDFSHRNKLLSAQDLPRPAGNSQDGDVSPQGDLIAFAWSYGTDPSVKRLAIVRRDGAGLREFPAVKQPDGFCWSGDGSKLVVHARTISNMNSSAGKFYLVDVLSNNVQEIGSASAWLTPQCWSPDAGSFVYEVPETDLSGPGHRGTIERYDLAQKQRFTLTRGSYATWSPASDTIGFLDGDDYYTVDSSGKQKTLLFHAPNARSGLLWSPDSRFVAYGVCCKYSGPTTLLRFYVRRLGDNLEDWIADVGDVPHALHLHWVKPKRLGL